MAMRLLFTVVILLVLCFFATPANTLKLALLLDGSYLTDAYSQAHARSLAETVDVLRAQNISVQSVIEENISATDVYARYAYYQQSYGADIIISPNAAHRAGFLQFINTTQGSQQYFITAVSLGAPTNRSFSLDGNIYRATYLAGKTCASVTRTNAIGIIATTGTKAGPSQINAFILGARAANPTVSIYLMFNLNITNSSIVEKHIANDMIQLYNVDCMLGGTNTPGAYEVVARSNNVTIIGVYENYRYLYGDSVLFSITFDWTPLYLKAIYGYLNGTYPGKQTASAQLGTSLLLTEFSTQMPDATFALLEQTQARLSANQECIFHWSDVNSLLPPSAYNQTFSLVNSTVRCLAASQVTSISRYLLPYVFNPYNLTIDGAIKRIYVPAISAVPIVFYVFVALIITLIILAGYFVLHYRRLPLILSTSPEFIFVMLFGYVLMLCAVLTFFGAATNLACMARVILFFLGFGLVQQASFVKNFRINRIFNNKSLDVFPITAKTLFLQGILPAVGIQILLLVLWCVLDPYSAVLDANSPILADDQVYLRCASKTPIIFAIEFVYNGALVLGNVVLSILNRNVPYAMYKETQQVQFSSFATIFMCFMCLLVSFAIIYQVTSEAYLYSGSILLLVLIHMLFLLGERLFLVIKGETEFRSSDATSLHTSSGLRSYRAPTSTSSTSQHVSADSI